MSELLPCPFCGLEPYFNSGEFTGEVNVYAGHPAPVAAASVGCEICGIEFYIEVDACSEPEDEATRQAIIAWNTRYERTCRPSIPKGTTKPICSECGLPLGGFRHYCTYCGAKAVSE